MSRATRGGSVPKPKNHPEASPVTVISDIEYAFIESLELDEAAQELVRTGKLRVSLITSTKAPSLRIDGPCPRCGHDYSDTEGLRILTSTVRGVPTSGTPDSSTPGAPEYFADFLCDCKKVHANAPTGARGCGASYMVSGQ